MAEFASKGIAGAGLGLGIAGTALGLMSNGALPIFGRAAACESDCAVNRYELQKEQTIAELKAQIALRDANLYNDQKQLEMYRYIDGKFNAIEGKLTEQAVYNATNTATISCMAQQIAQLQGLTKLVIPITSVCPEPAVATTTTT